MMDLFASSDTAMKSDKQAERAWEKVQSWKNPFADDESETTEHAEANSRTSSRRKKKRSKRKSRKVLSEEEVSQAETLLDDLLGDIGEDGVQKFPKVEEGMEDDEGDSVNGVRHDNKEEGYNPFAEKEEEQETAGEEIDHVGYKALLSGQRTFSAESADSSNPFDADSEVGEDPNLDVPELNDEDDSSIEPPNGYGSNPFETDANTPDEDDSVDVSVEILKVPNSPEKGEMTDRTASESFDTNEPGPEDDSQDEIVDEEEEDIVESSKRLLRMADRRIEYQKQNDEVKLLKDQIDSMKTQAGAMSEQLRRAIDTKCDLVLAQTEMERFHEQSMSSKDDEMKNLRAYIQEMLEKQALNDLNFMNEIAELSKKVGDLGETHRKELEDRDHHIATLQFQVQNMKAVSVRGNSSRVAFKSHLIDGTPLACAVSQV